MADIAERGRPTALRSPLHEGSLRELLRAAGEVEAATTGTPGARIGGDRCLGSHLARMELRVALEEWHRAVPDYAIEDGVTLMCSQGLRAIDNLELIW